MGNINVIPISSEHGLSNVFIDHLLKDIDKLQLMIDRGDLDGDVQRIGAEQEVNFIDPLYRPSPVNMEVLQKANDKHFTYEHARFNGEINIDPIVLKRGGLNSLEKQTIDLTKKLRTAAQKLGADLILVGILPTIRKHDLDIKNLTPISRYYALNELFKRLRGEPYSFRIEGKDLLIDKHETSMYEACNTSWQIHLQIPAKEFVAMYNWSQAIAGPVLSCATNSPVLLGKRLWRETRIALFQQAIDTRSTTHFSTEKVPRVFFGTDWLKKSVLEIFREDIARHRVILSTHFEPSESKDKVDKLKALTIHNGTIYRWNRPCYGITEGKPHLRIENRYLPAGPTIIDQVANSAFWIGLMKGMPPEAHEIAKYLDFDEVKSGFIKAARMGLGAQFKWINGKRIPAKQLILKHLLPIAYHGLKKAGIPDKEAHKYLDIIKQRVTGEKTGSQWILNAVEKLKKNNSIADAMIITTAGFLKRQKENKPVHTWTDIDENELKDNSWRYHCVDQIMSRDIFSVQPDDPVIYAAHIMHWRDINHLLVIKENGELEGLLTAGNLLPYVKQDATDILVKEAMIKTPITVAPHTYITDALQLMINHNIDSLPVVESNNRVVGFISIKDLLKVTSFLFQQIK